jgi:DNA-binding NarL/FixJ family response regulator
MVAHGHVVFDSTAWEELAGREEHPDSDEVQLSPRARDVLVRLSWGLSNREIADELGISAETVKTHIDRLYKKLGVATRTDAVAKALRAGLIE